MGTFSIKNIALLAIRIYLGYNLFFVAEQGGLAKWNWGAKGIAENLVSKIGSPFDMVPMVSAYLVMLAECVGPLAIMVGFQSKVFGFLLTGCMAIACYAHMVLWGQGFDSIITNKANVHGAGVYGLLALIIMQLGAGGLSLDGLLRSPKKGDKKRE